MVTEGELGRAERYSEGLENVILEHFMSLAPDGVVGQDAANGWASALVIATVRHFDCTYGRPSNPRSLADKERMIEEAMRFLLKLVGARG